MKKILVIEGDSIGRRLVTEPLRREGYEVVEAAEGQRGIKEVRDSNDFTAVFLAQNLPGLSGMDTLIAIRKFRSSLPVILLMDREDREYSGQAMRRGATDFIVKPVSLETLIPPLTHVTEKLDLSRRVERQIQRLQLLEKSALELTSLQVEDMVPEDVIRDDLFLKKTIDLIGEVLEAKKVSLMILDPGRNELILAHSSWIPKEKMASVRQPLSGGVAGWVAREGKSVVVRDAVHDPRFSMLGPPGQYESPSFVCTPLFYKKKVVGTISANDRMDRTPFSESDLSILNTFAHQISMAIAGISTSRKLQRESRKLSAVLEAASAILSAVEPSEVFLGIADRVRSALGADASALFSLQESGEGLQLEALAGVKIPEKDCSRNMAAGVVARVAADGPLFIPFASRAKEVEPARDFPPGLPPMNFGAVPVKIKGKTQGVLAVYNCPISDKGPTCDMSLLEAVASQAALAIKNAWLYQNLMKSIDEVVAANGRLESAREELQAKAAELSALRKKVPT